MGLVGEIVIAAFNDLKLIYYPDNNSAHSG